ncbi:peroxidase-like [Arctopsyche grandis]|uniref:peroxidase-like n=1 Tax=Arctopsyche grandis TaxID=121162 RepID=UPI00406D7D22
MNTVSNFLDGSPIYSSKSIYADRLRQFLGGKLHLTEKQLLPSSPDPNDNCDSSSTFGQCPCYLTGDSRVNQTPSLAALQTILAREHNKIAEGLERINPHWNDEKLFQEARKIIIAQLQHITYQEWLPLCIGREYVTRFKISPIGLYSYDYDSNVNPGIINAFATAAFRFFHTLIPGNLMVCPSESHDKDENLRLSDHYLNPSIMEYYENGLEAILRGTIYQPAMEADTSFSSEITNYLFKSINSSGIDLISMDIQRGRDHGLASYNVYRSTCGMRRANTFEELSGEISGDRIVLLKSMYEHVDDVDLFVGASMETDVHGSILGPTFQCIVGEQFYRTRVGDRYFYDVADMPHSFSSEQMREIKKASMARLICDNSDVKKVQPRAFEMISEHNPMCDCEDLDRIPMIDLQYWKESW